MAFFKPLDQFEILVYWPILFKFGNTIFDISLTSFSCTLLLMVCLFVFLFSNLNFVRFIPSNLQIHSEFFVKFVHGMFIEQIGTRVLIYFPFGLSLFSFILFANLIGMFPFSFAITSQFAITFTLSVMVLSGLTLLGILKHNLHFFSLFIPQGVPGALVPFLMIMEVISYLMRGVSLAVRLFANIMAGHSLLHILSGFGLKLSGVLFLNIIFSPFYLIFVIYCFEWLIAILQAYVFFLLFLIYLQECLDLH